MIWTITSFILTGGLIAYFWPKIVFFFSKKLIPWIRNHMGNKVADIVADVIAFIDKGIVAVRRTVKSLWKGFLDKILGKDKEYIDNEDGTYTVNDTTYIPSENDNNKVQVITQQYEVEWEDLPPKIRHEQIRRNAKRMKQDDKKIMESKFLEQANKKGVSKKELLELEC